MPCFNYLGDGMDEYSVKLMPASFTCGQAVHNYTDDKLVGITINTWRVPSAYFDHPRLVVIGVG